MPGQSFDMAFRFVSQISFLFHHAENPCTVIISLRLKDFELIKHAQMFSVTGNRKKNYFYEALAMESTLGRNAESRSTAVIFRPCPVMTLIVAFPDSY